MHTQVLRPGRNSVDADLAFAYRPDSQSPTSNRNQQPAVGAAGGTSSSHFETDDIDELMAAAAKNGGSVNETDGGSSKDQHMEPGVAQKPNKPGIQLVSPGIRKSNLDTETDLDASDVEHAHS